eukprot:TRINITY_DN27399_c0_g1_i1.p1 TRINITY_DN27399_c0_g1~~TRINITY_DN27399_c0_g1_i1.p1  ORF type:complete len:675 (-),score=180.67 TRINITY_DN27399_c0_g1_i1:95-2119(-)
MAEPDTLSGTPATNLDSVVPTLSSTKSLRNLRNASSQGMRRVSSARQASAAAIALENAASGFFTRRQMQEFVSENGAEMLRKRRQQYLQGAGLWTFAQRPSFGLPLFIKIGVILIVPVALALVLLGFGVDVASQQRAGREFGIYDLIWTMAFPDLDQGRTLVQNLTVIAAVILGLLIAVVTFVLQLASGRLTPRVSHLVFRDRMIGTAVGAVVLTMIYCLWVLLCLGIFYNSRFNVWVCFLLVLAELVMLVPFVIYLFWFLEADKVVSKIMDSGLKAAELTVSNPDLDIDVEQQQVRVNQTIEHLMGAANSALKRKDKDITAMIVNALLQFTLVYGNYKDALAARPAWFRIPKWIRQSSDFLTKVDDELAQLERSQVWVEWKILQSYKTLFNDSFKHMKETCYQIATNTQVIGDIAARRGDIETLNQVIHFFNTYRRAGLNKVDVRTVYNCLYQYRKLAEALIDEGQRVRKLLAGSDLAADFEHALNDIERSAVRVAKFIRYYGGAAADRSVGNKAYVFVVETVAQDMRMILEKALKENSFAHDELLAVFLTLYDGTEDGGPVIGGVRKAQLILATTYVAAERLDYAEMVCELLREESNETLWTTIQELSNDTTRDFWEISERGQNMHYMDTAQREAIPRLLAFFPGIMEDAELLMQRSKDKRYIRKQQLCKFD